MSELPVVVVGAGPVGLAAAAELVARGMPVLVLERGSQAGAAVTQWHHVRLFSQWSELISPAARRLLEPQGWQAPDGNGYPTGREWSELYLRPLAQALGEHVRFDAEVVGVARRGRDRVVDAGRESEPLTVHVHAPDGVERITAAGVIDASGTWGSPNPLGGDGLPALGEVEAAGRIAYYVPNLDDPAVAERYAGKHVVVAGSGHSALTALVALTGLADTRITWLLRRGSVGDTFGGGDADQLPARGALGLRAKKAMEQGQVRIMTGFRTESVRPEGGQLTLTSDSGAIVDDVDEVVVLTGFRPDLSWLSEIRLELDATLQAPVRLAPLIDPNVHSCGTVYPHGVAELEHPEPGVYLAGMKSYGRAPTFLAMTGYEQVRSLVAALAGDRDAAERVELTLPETGVCGGSGLFDPEASESPEGGCCSTSTGPQELTLSQSLPRGA